jgi:acetylornithine deacetylase
MDPAGALGDLAERLVRIDSANPDTANGPGEAEIAAFAACMLTAAGLEVHVESFAPGRPSLVARAPGAGGGRSVMLVGHLDTFARPERSGRCRARSDGVLRGSGAFDMKAGVATLMTVAADAVAGGLRGDVLLALVADEEHRSLGIRSVLRRWRADAAVVGEGTGLSLGMEHEGRIQLVVETDEPCGAMPLELRVALACRGVAGRLSYAADGHRESWAHVRRVLSPGESPRGPLRDLRAAIERSFRVVHTDVREAFRAEGSDPLAGCLAGSLRRRRRDARHATLEGWTEAGVLCAAGVPTVVFGPAGGGAHTSAEWADLHSAVVGRDILREAVSEYCS